MGRFILIFFGIYALLALLVSGIVHFSTYFSTIAVNHESYLVLILHLSIFALIPTLIPYSKREQGEVRFSIDFSGVPRWGQCLISFLLIYAVVNAALSLLLIRGETAQIVDGEYMIRYGTNHVVVTPEVYFDFMKDGLRGLSGHWMFLYALYALRLLSPRKILERHSEPKYDTNTKEYALPWKRLLVVFGGILAMVMFGVAILVRNHYQYHDDHVTMVFGCIWLLLSVYALFQVSVTPLAITFPNPTQITIHSLIRHQTLFVSDIRIKELSSDTLTILTPAKALRIDRVIQGCEGFIHRIEG